MKSIYRLKKNYQYNYVYKHARSVGDSDFVLLYCPSNCKQSKVGFSLSKKFGNAVQRNRLRRQLKAAMSQFMPDVADGYNLVIVPRKQHSYAYGAIVDSLRRLLTKSGVLQL